MRVTTHESGVAICDTYLDDRINVEVGADGALALAHLKGLISFVPVLREAILEGENAHGLDTQLRTRTHDTAGVMKQMAKLRSQGSPGYGGDTTVAVCEEG